MSGVKLDPTLLMPRALGLPQAATPLSPEAARAKQAADNAKVGRDFEAILVRQMLSQTKVAGSGGGYADMAIEALATSITAAGGLGMGKALEAALSKSLPAAVPSQATDSPTATPANTDNALKARQISAYQRK